jgi:fructose-1,6-bisphosphatase
LSARPTSGWRNWSSCTRPRWSARRWRQAERGGRQADPVVQGQKTFSEFIIGEQQRIPGATGGFTALLSDIRLACKRIAYLAGKGALAQGMEYSGGAGGADTHGPKLHLQSNDMFIGANERGGHVAGMVSEELERPYEIPGEYPCGPYLLLFDPLDGSTNVDVNAALGSIFSVLRCPQGAVQACEGDFLQPGVEQVCAGYAIYGPTTILVLTLGRGVHGFTLDREIGEFMLTHPDMRIPEDSNEFAINASNERFWGPPVKRYISECLAGESGPRGKDFRMRWVASLVAEIHRILVRGGVFLSPHDTREPDRPGRLRLLCEANPLAMLVEQAGGAASTGTQRVLELAPASLHERVPVILGSKSEVQRIEQYHREHEQGLDQPYTSPLFNTRSLFTQS